MGRVPDALIEVFRIPPRLAMVHHPGIDELFTRSLRSLAFR